VARASINELWSVSWRAMTSGDDHMMGNRCVCRSIADPGRTCYCMAGLGCYRLKIDIADARPSNKAAFTVASE